jgi:hypothetical protein
VYTCIYQPRITAPCCITTEIFAVVLFLPLPSDETATIALSPSSHNPVSFFVYLAEGLAKNRGRILRQNPSKSQDILFMYFFASNSVLEAAAVLILAYVLAFCAYVCADAVSLLLLLRSYILLLASCYC